MKKWHDGVILLENVALQFGVQNKLYFGTCKLAYQVLNESIWILYLVSTFQNKMLYNFKLFKVLHFVWNL